MAAPNSVLMLFGFFFITQAHATLGGKVLSVREQFSKLRNGYSVHEMKLNERIIKEYVLPSGTVFAVSWRGVTQPDLTLLLGSFYKDYAYAMSNMKRRSRGAPVRIRLKNLVVEKFGHMRDIRGHAYIPDLLPQEHFE